MLGWIPVFLSRPTKLSPAQRAVAEKIHALVEDHDLSPKTIGISDTSRSNPLKDVAIIARACYGGIVLGFRQYWTARVVRLPGAVDPSSGKNLETTLEDRCFGTPWNQLEAGVLFALQKPLLLFAEPGVEEGVFERGVSEYFVNRMPASLDDTEGWAIARANIAQWSAEVKERFRRWS